jgi:RNA polymerase sigma-70 factor (ECF subfamily)
MREIDPETLNACRRGDRAAFRMLVTTYQDGVFAFCAALVGAEAADVTQETFLRVHGAIRRFDPNGPAKLSTWMLQIARRLCRDIDRKVRPQPRAPELPASLPGTDAGNPEQALAFAALTARLGRAFAALPEEQRAALALRSWDGLEYEEIAVIEEVPVGTIRSRLARARQALQAAIRDHVEQGATPWSRATTKR